MEKEIWKTYPPIKWVQFSNLGRVRTLDRLIESSDGKKRHIRGRVLSQYRTRNGYMQADVSVNGKTIHLSVHRGVTMCFLPNPLDLPEVNHCDCDRANNRLDNLEWCTPEYNRWYAEKYGNGRKGTAPVFAVNLRTFEISWFPSRMEASRKLKCSDGHIYDVIKGRRNHTHDCWFTDADSNAIKAVRLKFGDSMADKITKLLDDKELQLA